MFPGSKLNSGFFIFFNPPKRLLFWGEWSFSKVQELCGWGLQCWTFLICCMLKELYFSYHFLKIPIKIEKFFVLCHIKGNILCFSVSFNLQMMLQSQTAVLNDTKVWNNEVRVCSSNPCGLFVMALNAPFSSVFFNLRPLICHSVLGFSIGSSGRCVFELANQSRVSL